MSAAAFSSGALRPEDLSELVGLPLTDEQLGAATAPLEPGVVVAGAGSGKTTVMAARVVWLVASGQVRPDQVLGLTFTNRAANELALRIRTMLARIAVPAREEQLPADGAVLLVFRSTTCTAPSST